MGQRPGALEEMVSKVDPGYWAGQRVFLTGHTGFKGAWLTLLLRRLGARVTGYSLDPPSQPNLFQLAIQDGDVRDARGDIRDLAMLRQAMQDCAPTVVLHLAAQSLVLASYRDPVGTYATNVMGTVHVLEAIRACASVQAAVIVTSDKCYENREWHWPYRETDHLGGHDPYSSSKACAELATSAYVRSFLGVEGLAVATARAGNVIGGGDWAEDRLVPDIVRALAVGNAPGLRHPESVRPWQHVLEPLYGYLLLVQQMATGRSDLADAWNFGPDASALRSVGWVAQAMLDDWGGLNSVQPDNTPHAHEAGLLALDSSKARARLGWQPRLTVREAVEWTVDWYKSVPESVKISGNNAARAKCLEQIDRYLSLQGLV